MNNVNRLKLPKNAIQSKKKYKDYYYEFGTIDLMTNSCYTLVNAWVMPDNMLEGGINDFKRRLKVFSNRIGDVYFGDLKWTIVSRNIEYSKTNKNDTKNKFTFIQIEMTFKFNEIIEHKSGDFKFIQQNYCQSLIDWLSNYSDGLCFSPINVK